MLKRNFQFTSAHRESGVPTAQCVLTEQIEEDQVLRREADSRSSARRKSLIKCLIGFLVYLILFGIALGISWHDRAFRTEFGDYPDESAHYMTGLMFHDYAASLNYPSPIKFAENFYVHYPRIGIGHWPPVFYLIEGVWMLLFSPSAGSMVFLMVAFTALLATIFYQMLANQFGHLMAFAAALVLVALPLVQAQTTAVMAEVPLTVCSLVAAIFFGRFLQKEEFKDAVWFGVFASIAILTKGSALALGWLPPIGILITRKWHLLGKTSVWVSASFVLVLCGPWYWMTRPMQKGTFLQPSSTLSYAVSAAQFYSLHLAKILGCPLAALTAIGLIVSAPRLAAPSARRGFWAAMVGLLVGFFVVVCVVPAGKEERYLLPAVPAALAFSLAGIDFLGSKLPDIRIKDIRIKPVLLGVILLCLCLVSPFHFQRQRNYGFAPIAQMLASSSQFRDDVILIASDADGEGMLISEVAMREKRPGHVVLRASKILNSSDWLGNGLTPRFQGPEQVQDYLNSIPVGFVILDYSLSHSDFRDYEGLLEQAIVSHQNSWKLFGTYPIWRKGHEHPDAAKVYVLDSPHANPQGIIRIDMTNMLGKDLTLKLGEGDSH
jgi:hypothetical protein